MATQIEEQSGIASLQARQQQAQAEQQQQELARQQPTIQPQIQQNQPTSIGGRESFVIVYRDNRGREQTIAVPLGTQRDVIRELNATGSRIISSYTGGYFNRPEAQRQELSPSDIIKQAEQQRGMTLTPQARQDVLNKYYSQTAMTPRQPTEYVTKLIPTSIPNITNLTPTKTGSQTSTTLAPTFDVSKAIGGYYEIGGVKYQVPYTLTETLTKDYPELMSVNVLKARTTPDVNLEQAYKSSFLLPTQTTTKTEAVNIKYTPDTFFQQPKPSPSETALTQAQQYAQRGEFTKAQLYGLGGLALSAGEGIVNLPRNILGLPRFGYEAVTNPLGTISNVATTFTKNPVEFLGYYGAQAGVLGGLTKAAIKPLVQTYSPFVIKSGETLNIERGISFDTTKRILIDTDILTKGKFDILTGAYLGVKVGKGIPKGTLTLGEAFGKVMSNEPLTGYIIGFTKPKLSLVTRSAAGKEVGTIVMDVPEDVTFVQDKTGRAAKAKTVITTFASEGNLRLFVSDTGKVTSPDIIIGLKPKEVIETLQFGSQPSVARGGFTNLAGRGRPPTTTLMAKDVLFGNVDVGKPIKEVPISGLKYEQWASYTPVEIAPPKATVYPEILTGKGFTELRIRQPKGGVRKVQFTTNVVGRGLGMETIPLTREQILQTEIITKENPDIIKSITKYYKPEQTLGLSQANDLIGFAYKKLRVMRAGGGKTVAFQPTKNIPVRFLSVSQTIPESELTSLIVKERTATFAPQAFGEVLTDAQALKELKAAVQSRLAFERRMAQLNAPAQLADIGAKVSSQVAKGVKASYAKSLTIPITGGLINYLGNIPKTTAKQAIKTKVQESNFFLQQTPFQKTYSDIMNKPVTKETQTQTQQEKQTQRELEKQIQQQGTIQISKQLEKQIQQQVQKQTQQEKQVQQQIQKQIQQQLQKQVQLQKQTQIEKQTQIQPPKTPPPIVSISQKSEDVLGIKKILNKLRAYNVYSKRYGKEILLGKNLPKGRAFEKGIQFISQNLGATTFLRPSGFTTQKDVYFGLNAQKYRQYRIVKGQKVFTPLQVIQKRGARLSSFGERAEIRQARIKSILFTPSIKRTQSILSPRYKRKRAKTLNWF